MSESCEPPMHIGRGRVAVAIPARAPLTFARTGIVARTDLGPGCQAGRRAKRLMSVPISPRMSRAARLTPGMLSSCSICGSNGSTSRRICSSGSAICLQQLNELEGQAQSGVRDAP